jgi:hypothetical protein
MGSRQNQQEVPEWLHPGKPRAAQGGPASLTYRVDTPPLPEHPQLKGHSESPSLQEKDHWGHKGDAGHEHLLKLQ